MIARNDKLSIRDAVDLSLFFGYSSDLEILCAISLATTSCEEREGGARKSCIAADGEGLDDAVMPTDDLRKRDMTRMYF